MPPNFLPLIGNGVGDWLCLRFVDPDVAQATGQATDVCHWYHGGGDWLPWGDSLAEALLFDWVLPELPQSDRRHADPAESNEDQIDGETGSGNARSLPPYQQTDHPWVRWADRFLPGLAKLGGQEESLAHQLLRQGICEIPVRCQLVIDALNSEPLNRIDRKSANQLGVAWNDLMRWCFDLRYLPGDVASKLQQRLAMTDADLDPSQQQWDEVERHADVIARRASDLSWGHDLLGYCRFRSGDQQGAIESFSKAIRCSIFTDQSVRFRTHWATSSDGVAKFAARFLSDLPNSNVALDHMTGMHQLGCVPTLVDLSKMVEFLGRQTSDAHAPIRSSYPSWLLHQAEAVANESPATAARLIYAAGWDLGAEPLRSYGKLLDQYIRACQDARWESHERLAVVHRRGLQARYNL
jgi:hypothetical protein